MNNIPEVKLGVIAVSRDCFPIDLAQRRRSAVVKALKAKGIKASEIKTIIEGGMSMPSQKTRGQRFAAWFGRKCASRRKGVTVEPTCLISPEAKICSMALS